MSDLRTAAQQALDALYRWHMTDGETVELMPAFDALRAALAEPDPFQPDWANYRQGVKDGQAEPDAVYWYVGTDGKYYSSHEAELFLDANTKALYKKPPQWRLDKGDLIPLVAYRPRKPLTDEEIDQIAIKCLDAPEPGWNRNLARAIERAHGIGGDA